MHLMLWSIVSHYYRTSILIYPVNILHLQAVMLLPVKSNQGYLWQVSKSRQCCHCAQVRKVVHCTLQFKINCQLIECVFWLNHSICRSVLYFFLFHASFLLYAGINMALKVWMLWKLTKYILKLAVRLNSMLMVTQFSLHQKTSQYPWQIAKVGNWNSFMKKPMSKFCIHCFNTFLI